VSGVQSIQQLDNTIFTEAICEHSHDYFYRGADKSLTLLGRIQATATEDFDVHISYLLP